MLIADALFRFRLCLLSVSHSSQGNKLSLAVLHPRKLVVYNVVAIGANGLNSDLHGSAEYRAHLISVMASRAVAAMA